MAKTTSRLLGAHTSTAGGVTTSIPRALQVGFTASQIFVKNNQQWMGPAMKDDEVRSFLKARDAASLYVFGHAGYLINLAGAKPENVEKSMNSLEHELLRADALQIPFLVMHPGSHGGDGEEIGLQRIVQGINEVVKRTPKVKTRIALENTAASGSHLGGKFEHLKWVIDHVEKPDRLGVCLDTAHLFEAGFPIHEKTGYDLTFKQFEKIIGLDWLLAFHVNDSKTPLGSRVDRHDHLGKGKIGPECFQLLMNDPRWTKTPMVLETPKGEEMHEDVENIAFLKSLIKK
ncbi:MAG: deoxyribonuclease IV [Verrucomicrobiota bacterium]